MADTIIQIKRSTTTGTPANLQPGELAYTSNGEVLFIGSAVGSDVANVVAIAGARNPGVLTANQALVANASSWIDSIQTSKLIIGTTSETINVSSISTDGSFTSASNTELATTWAIKDYVDNNSAAVLSGLDDVDTTGVANNTYLVYDNDAAKWEPHTISGTANEVELTYSGQDLTIGLPDDVSIAANLAVTSHISANTLDVGGGLSNLYAVDVTTNLNVGGSANVLSTAYFQNTVTSLGEANVASLYVPGVATMGNTTISGDLTVTGTVTTIDTTNLVVEDSLIRLARNQANTDTFVDSVDIGFYGVYGNTSATFYTGLARDSSANVYVLFDNVSTAPDNDNISTSDDLATLYAFLNSGALVTNTTSVTITANSTVSVGITANTLVLDTELEVASGGTGRETLTAGAVLYGDGTNQVGLATIGSNGQVLQVVSNLPAFGGLDGGTF